MAKAISKLAITGAAKRMGMGRLALAATAGLAALAMAPAAAEAGTVVASSGPSAGTYRVGTQVSDTQRITLQAGDSVTVLSGGSTRVLRGPGTFILAQGGAATTGNTAIAGLMQRPRGQARVASSRTGPTDAPVSNPNIFYVDIAAAGTVCLSNVDRVNLWRADTADEASYSIAPTGAPGEAVNVHFGASEMLARWDSALQISGGQSYTITSEADGTSVQVTFALLSAVPEDPEALAQALISNGCNLQLAQIVTAAETEG